MNAVKGKVHMYFIEWLEPHRAPHELRQLWDVGHGCWEKVIRVS